jgi:hypothetical protein
MPSQNRRGQNITLDLSHKPRLSGPCLAEAAARKLVEIAAGIEPVQDGRIYIEMINYPMLFKVKASAAEYKAGLDLAIERGSLRRSLPSRASDLRNQATGGKPDVGEFT